MASGSADLKAWAKEVEVMAKRVNDKVKVGAIQHYASISQRNAHAYGILYCRLDRNYIPCQAICAAACADLESLGQEDKLQLSSDLLFSGVFHGHPHGFASSFDLVFRRRPWTWIEGQPLACAPKSKVGGAPDSKLML